MKIKYSFVLIAVLALMLVVTGVLAATTIVAVENEEIGNAGHYCVQRLDYDFGIKIEAWGGPGGSGDMTDPGTYKGAYDDTNKFDPDFNNTIYLTKATRYEFNWNSYPYAIGAIVVQGGWMDNIYFYVPPVLSDNGLVPYDSGTNKKETISHISFCWNHQDENGNDECYQEETAWADGTRYVEQGNWATYVTYENGLTVPIYAGQEIFAGYATFTEKNEEEVVIDIALMNDFIFYYDILEDDDEEDHNLKVQDYDMIPPAVNPAPGQFEWKFFVPVGSTTSSITVPLNYFYGVHLDVAQLVDCEAED